MFDIGWSELLVIGVVAIVVVGPKELPRLMRTFGAYTGKVRRMAADFQRQFEEAVRDSELDEVRKAMHEFRAEASSQLDMRAPVEPPLMLSKQEVNPGAAPEPSLTLPASSEPKPRKKRSTAKPSTAKPRTRPETASEPKSPQTKSAKARKPRKAPDPKP